ncbi:MAG: adenosylcobinamide-GDP ribazoletransferase [Burkholderiaceae bacterium]
MRNFIRHYLLALQFFTRIPVTGALAQWVGFSPALLRASAAHFPGVGWLVGAVAAGTYAAAVLALPAHPLSPLLAALVCTAATVLLTGGFHEDGLADMADGLGGSSERLRALEIMKDSRIGSFGALALVLALLGKVTVLALLGSISLPLVLAALWAGHVLSRFAPLVLVVFMPHVGDLAGSGSKSKPLADAMAAGRLFPAFLWCFMPLAILYIAGGATVLIVSCGACAAALLGLWRLLARRLQGFTGDCLGAAQQLCELAFYLGVAAAYRP